MEFAHCESEASSWSKSSKSGQEKEEVGENQLIKEKLKKDEETNGEGLEGEEVRNLYKSQFHPIEYMRQYYTKIKASSSPNSTSSSRRSSKTSRTAS